MQTHPGDSFAELVATLASSNPAERNAAAIALMDLGDPRAMEPLIQAIELPQNRHARGTLVYALSAFDCVGRFVQLFSWALQGGYEASGEALAIIRAQRLVPTALDSVQCRGLLAAASKEPGDVDEELLAQLQVLIEENAFGQCW